jgi:hypothetical protein
MLKYEFCKSTVNVEAGCAIIPAKRDSSKAVIEFSLSFVSGKTNEGLFEFENSKL